MLDGAFCERAGSCTTCAAVARGFVEALRSSRGSKITDLTKQFSGISAGTDDADAQSTSPSLVETDRSSAISVGALKKYREAKATSAVPAAAATAPPPKVDLYK